MRGYGRIWVMLALSVGAILIASGSMATGTTGKPVLLGRHNCSGMADDPTCSGGRRPTSIDWDLDDNPVPSDAGFAAEGDPALIGATNPQYVTESEWITGVEGFGSDRGGFFYGVNQGVFGNSEQLGVLGSSSEVGVEARGGDVGLVAAGPLALDARGGVAFSSAGFAVVAEGRSSARVSPGVAIGSETKILATVQSRGGVVRRVATGPIGSDTFTIWLTAPATQRVRVAYFVIG